MTSPPHARALAPADPGHARTPSNEASQKSRKVSTACSACRRRRSKCSGENPCDKCIEYRTECVIDESLDKRRKAPYKRKLEELERDRDLLNGLVEMIRAGGESQVDQLLNLIRSNAPLEEISAAVDAELAVLRGDGRGESVASAQLEQVQAEVSRLEHDSPTSGSKFMGLQRLCDTPIITVPAKPWTTVTDDNDFVSHLVSLWFTWEHLFFPVLDRDLFVEAMQAGDRRSPHCSPFLVNVMLAEACLFSDYPEAYSVPGDISSLGLDFQTEAKRLFDAEEGRFSLATAQGVIILYGWTCTVGKDRYGWLLLQQAIYMYQELGLSRAYQAPETESHESRVKMQRARDVTAWAIYIVASMSTIAFQKTPLLKQPQRPRPEDGHGASTLEWSPYPRPGPSMPAHWGCLFNQMCNLSDIGFDLNDLLFGEKGRPSGPAFNDAAESLHKRLQTWYDDLPDCFSLERRQPPHILNLHMHYHRLVMTLFGFYTVPEEAEPSASFERAREMYLFSAEQIGHLMRLYRRDWGFDRFPVVVLHYTIVAMFMLMDDLGSESRRAAFVELCIASRAASRRFKLGKGMLRLVQLTAKKMQLDLPPETMKLFHEFEEQNWEPNEAHDYSSHYPNFLAAIERDSLDPGTLALDTLLEKWEGLTLKPEKD